MLDINLKQLEVFVTAAQFGSFTRAAQVLYLTQPTVSAHIQSLEQTLGGALFFRDSRRRITLTPLGDGVLCEAKEILNRCQALQKIAQPKPCGNLLSIAASSVPAQCLVPPLMAAFAVQQPNCRYQLQKTDTAHVHNLLEQGEVRIGFVGSTLPDSHCDYFPLFQDKLVLVTANTPQFALQKQDGVLGHSLLRQPMICREAGSGTRQQFDGYLQSIGFAAQDLQIVAEIDQTEAILNAVESGLGVAVCSALTARDRIHAGKLLSFELQQDSFYRGLYLAIPQKASFSPLEQEFIGFAKSTSCADLLER